MSRLWILGAPDPEMEAIERLLRECGERVIHATSPSGERIRPGQFGAPIHIGDASTVYTVECDLPLACGEPEHEPDMGQVIINGARYMSARYSAIRIDHHCPGDPGYGLPPSKFLSACSLGQVITKLVRLRSPNWEVIDGPPFDPGTYELTTIRAHGRVWSSDPGVYHTGSGDWEWAVSFAVGAWYVVPRDLVLCAAADHCLGAAYRGECPGVDPDALMRWRAESRAKFQGRSVEDVLAAVERAKEALMRAPLVSLGGRVAVRDMRDAYTVSTVLVSPFAEGATVDAAGVGDSTAIVFGPRVEGSWDEGSHHTFVRRGVPELPEAAARLGIGYVSGPLVGPDGRRKITCSGTPEEVRAFLDHWAPAQGLTDLYGDPARGFAGGYQLS